MVTTYQMAEVASHIGEPPRAAMLAALMDGRALTATELASVAGVTPQTASSHLARLAAAKLLQVNQRGRHRYHRLATPEVARLLESVMQLASAHEPPGRRTVVIGPRDASMRLARTCYDHLAGRLGVAIAGALVKRGVIELDDDAGLVTDPGVAFLRRAGIECEGAAAAGRSSRPLCRPCLDWSERQLHIGGRLGAAICARFLEKRWVRRVADTRAVEITPGGHAALHDVFGITRLV
jgi:DNA-binding transcriptional ArsR family regulator